MTVHTLHATQERCEIGHFKKAGAAGCRRCDNIAAKARLADPRPAGRPALSLVPAAAIPVLSLVRPIAIPRPPATPAAPEDASTAPTAIPVPAAQNGAREAASGPQDAPQGPAGDKDPGLPVRPVLRPLPVAEVAAARAAMHARALTLPVRVMDWHGWGDGTATAALPDGTTFRYQPAEHAPFAAAVPCLLGSHHYGSIRRRVDLDALRCDADTCLEQHADFSTWATAAARDLSAAFAPRFVRPITPVVPLHDKDTHPDA